MKSVFQSAIVVMSVFDLVGVDALKMMRFVNFVKKSFGI